MEKNYCFKTFIVYGKYLVNKPSTAKFCVKAMSKDLVEALLVMIDPLLVASSPAVNPPKFRKGVNSVFLCTLCCIWLEPNQRVFKNKSLLKLFATVARIDVRWATVALGE